MRGVYWFILPQRQVKSAKRNKHDESKGPYVTPSPITKENQNVRKSESTLLVFKKKKKEINQIKRLESSNTTVKYCLIINQ